MKHLDAIIKSPTRYISINLQEGDPAVVYTLNDAEPFFNLHFEAAEDQKINSIITADENIQKLISSLSVISEKIGVIEDLIINKGSVYVHYNYLFTIRNGEVYLISITIEGSSLSHTLTSAIGKELGLTMLKPSWRGIYSLHTMNAFIESVFVQKQ